MLSSIKHAPNLNLTADTFIDNINRDHNETSDNKIQPKSHLLQSTSFKRFGSENFTNSSLKASHSFSEIKLPSQRLTSLLNRMQSGLLIQKYTRHGVSHQRQIFILPDLSCLCWHKPSKPHKLKAIAFDSIICVNIGISCSGSQKAMKRLAKISLDVCQRSFSLYLSPSANRRTVSIECKSQKEANEQIECIRQCMDYSKYYNDEIHLSLQFHRLRYKQNKTKGTKKEISRLFQKLNIGISKSKIRMVYKESGALESGKGLSFDEFFNIYSKLTVRDEFHSLFVRYSCPIISDDTNTFKHIMNVELFNLFLRTEQHQSNISLKDSADLMESFLLCQNKTSTNSKFQLNNQLINHKAINSSNESPKIKEKFQFKSYLPKNLNLFSYLIRNKILANTNQSTSSFGKNIVEPKIDSSGFDLLDNKFRNMSIDNDNNFNLNFCRTHHLSLSTLYLPSLPVSLSNHFSFNETVIRHSNFAPPLKLKSWNNLVFSEFPLKNQSEPVLQLPKNLNDNNDINSTLYFSEQDFIDWLSSEYNHPISPNHRRVYQDMNQPINNYYIATSHNTYLESDQVSGNSSTEMYAHILQLGCRCVEIDCQDSNNLPVVYHGYTLTSRLQFIDVIKTIDKYAFVCNSFPVIISLENHCSESCQQIMARQMVEVFGSKLALTSDENQLCCDTHNNLNEHSKENFYYTDINHCLPSPNQLQNKILLKGSRSAAIPELARLIYFCSQKFYLSIFNCSTESSQTNSNTSYKLKEIKIEDGLNQNFEKQKDFKFSNSFSNKNNFRKLNTNNNKLLVSTSRKSTKVDLSCCRLLLTFSDLKFGKIRSKCEEMKKLSRSHLLRCYPAAHRVKSSNYNPNHAQMFGCQLVALNYQTSGRAMALQLGKFEVNGQCGYVLKPHNLRYSNELINNDSKICEISSKFDLRLTVCIISASQLPKRLMKQKKRKRPSPWSVAINPYVKLAVYGTKKDKQKKKTKSIVDNGFNPIQNEKFVFSVAGSEAELSLLTFLVYNEDLLFEDELLASNAIPVLEIRQGYRFVPLRNHFQELLPSCGLYVHFKIEYLNNKASCSMNSAISNGIKCTK